MKMKLIILAVLLSLLFMASGCDKIRPNDPEGLGTAEALSNIGRIKPTLLRL
jgi:hypothetical protein